MDTTRQTAVGFFVASLILCGLMIGSMLAAFMADGLKRSGFYADRGEIVYQQKYHAQIQRLKLSGEDYVIRYNNTFLK